MVSTCNVILYYHVKAIQTKKDLNIGWLTIYCPGNDPKHSPYLITANNSRKRFLRSCTPCIRLHDRISRTIEYYQPMESGMLFHPGWHYSLLLSEQIPMRPFLTLEDCNEALPDSSGHRPLPGEVSAFCFLLTSIAMRTLRNLYQSISLDRLIPMHPVPMLSDHWLNGYAYFCTWVPRASTFKSLATGCYRHVDASRPIPFDSRGRADSNVTLADSGGHLPQGISALFTLVTSIAMWTLRTLYQSISLDRLIPTHPVPMLSDHWLNGYAYLCT